LALGLGHQDLEGQIRNIIGTLLLKEQIADLRCVAMGNKDTIMPGESRNLLNRNLEILKLFFHSAHLALADQGVAAKRYE
jgi:hypothetical protein